MIHSKRRFFTQVSFSFLLFASFSLPSNALRQCVGDETTDCLLDVPRLELRQLDTEQRRQLMNAFRDEKSQHNRKEWERILEGDLAHDIIRRLDDRLSVEGFFTPFWDARIDRRLDNPADSILFLDDFLPRNRGRRDRTGRQGDKKRDSTAHPLHEFKKTKNSQLLFVLHGIAEARVQIAESCATLCSLLDDWMFCDPNQNRCVARISPSGNCTRYSDVMGACFKSTCRAGVCVAATVLEDATLPPTSAPETPRTLVIEVMKAESGQESRKERKEKKRHGKKHRHRAFTTPSTTSTTADTLHWTQLPTIESEIEASGSTPDALEELLRDTDRIFENLDDNLEFTTSKAAVIGEGENAKKRSRTFRNLHIRPLQGGVIQEELTPVDDLDLDDVPSVPASPPKDLYAIPSVYVDNEITDFVQLLSTKESSSSSSSTTTTTTTISTTATSTTTTTDPILIENDEDFVVPSALKEESSTPYFNDVIIHKVQIETRPRIGLPPVYTGEHLPADAIPFSSPSPFPTVYLTATVIEGEYRRRARRQRYASGVTSYTRGANMPSGYTQIIEGNSDNGTTVLRVLDPRVGGILTEFNITVLDREGGPCMQMCRFGVRNMYRPCASDIVRLSPFAQYSDDISTFQTPEEALSETWTGQGYFRKRKQDYLLFKCPNKKTRLRRRKE